MDGGMTAFIVIGGIVLVAILLICLADMPYDHK